MFKDGRIQDPKQAYKMMILMDESEKKCWVTEVKTVLSRNGFYSVWLQQVVREEKTFLSELKRRLMDKFHSRMECNYSR